MRMALAALAAVLVVIPAMPAYAQETQVEESTSEKKCSTTAYATAKTAYVYSDIGVYARDVPTLQSGVTYSCESGWWVDVWNSTPLDFKTSGYDEETDFTIGYSRQAGPFQLDAKLAYYAIQPYDSANDDMILADITIGVPVEVGSATVTPYVEPFLWIGIKDMPNHTFIRTGISLAVPITDKWSLSADASRVFNLTDQAVSIVPTRHVDRADISVSRDMGNGWTITALAEVSGDLPIVWGLGASKSF